MGKIIYLEGDATAPKALGNKIIVHICNDVGGWGRGFVLAISKRWAAPEQQYRDWSLHKEDFALGSVQLVNVETDIWVANMVAQHGIYKDQNENPPIRYDAVLNALSKVATFAKEINATIHMPRIGCGLAGGTWDQIEPLIEEALLRQNIAVFVYDF